MLDGFQSNKKLFTTVYITRNRKCLNLIYPADDSSQVELEMNAASIG